MADVRMQMVVAVVRNEKKMGMLKRIFMVMSKNIFSVVRYYK